MLRVFWKVFDIHPDTPIIPGVQKIYRSTKGVLYSDSFVGYKKYPPDQDVAYIDVRVLSENENNDYLYDFRNLEIDEQDPDAVNSGKIANALGLNWVDGKPPYETDFLPNTNLDHRGDFLQQDLIVSYSIWCELHNQLMIKAEDSFRGGVFPRWIYAGARNHLFYIRPSSVANTWERKWIVSVKNNDNLVSIVSYRKYDSAIKTVKRYIKKTLDIRLRDRDLPNFKREVFTYDTGNGVTTIQFHKEKELE